MVTPLRWLAAVRGEEEVLRRWRRRVEVFWSKAAMRAMICSKLLLLLLRGLLLRDVVLAAEVTTSVEVVVVVGIVTGRRSSE